MNADMKWLDNPEVFRVNQLEAHSDHCYYLDYSDMKKEKNPLFQSLNGQWEFSYSKNVKSRPVNFYEETFDASGFDKIMVPGHIELAGYDKVRYINTMYPWEGKEYHRGAYSMEATGAEKGMFSEAEYNPVGSYIKYFDLDKSMCGKRIHICFEGVEEAMYLWLNGQFIGYAEDSFTPSEFDLTPYIKEKGNVLYAPCKGKVVPLTEVPDPTFSEKLLGDGFAVIPTEGKVYAPADAEVTMVFDTLHAITLTSSQGAEILIHIGLDTVTLKGAPFTAHVAAGDKVKKGDLLMDVDLDKIKEAGLNTITPVLICNTDDYEKISLQKEGDVLLDEAVLKIS